MKKLITLLVAGCMVLGSLGTAAAVDVKVSGQWQIHSGYYTNSSLSSKEDSDDHQDRLRFRQRFRTQVRFIADENLSGMLNFEIGDMNWGENAIDGSGGRSGGGLDADGYSIKVKWAYIDWTLPNTQIKTRIGVQAVKMPSVVAGNPILDADVAGITMNTQLTPELGLTAFWIRPHSNYTDSEAQKGGKNNWDDMDVFGFTLPIKTDNIRMTPWAMGALIGRDSDYYSTGDITAPNALRGKAATKGAYSGGRPVGSKSKMDSQGYAWWAGTTFQLPMLDPFFINIDAMAGGLETGDSDYDAFGYFIAADVGYKFSWGRASVVSWYSSGDDDKDDRGIIPGFAEVGGFGPTRYGLSGTKFRSADDILGTIGFGMWGVGLQIADVSFVDNLKHTARAFYMRGTNKGDALHGSGAGNTASWSGGEIFTTSDAAWEFNLLSEYKFSQNLTMSLDFAYVVLDLGNQRTNNDDTSGSFATMLGFQYSF